MTWTHPPPTEESTSFHREPRFHSQPRPQMAAQDVAPRPPQAQPRFPPVRTGPPPRPSTLPALRALAPWGKSTHSTAKLPSASSTPTPTLHPEAMVPVGAAAHGGLTSDQMAQPRPPPETQTPRAQPGTLLPRPGRFSLPLSPGQTCVSFRQLSLHHSAVTEPRAHHEPPKGGPPRGSRTRSWVDVPTALHSAGDVPCRRVPGTRRLGTGPPSAATDVPGAARSAHPRRLHPRTDPGARILGVLTGGPAWLLKLWGPGTAWEALHPLLVR